MSCERYAETIVDHAFGAELAAGAAAHLRGCDSCAALFDEQRRSIGELDRELQEAVTIEASPYFVQRVRARAVSAPAPTSRLPLSLAAAAAAILVALAGGYVLWTGDRGGPPAVAQATPTPQVTREPGSLRPPVPSGDAPAQTRVTPSSPARNDAAAHATYRTARTSAQKPEVIVPPDQGRAVARYLTLVRTGQFDASGLDTVVDVEGEPSELVVAPLAVQPLTIPDVGLETRRSVQGFGLE